MDELYLVGLATGFIIGVGFCLFVEYIRLIFKER